MKKKLLIPIVFCLLVSLTVADVRLPAIFGDHMVLQQKESVTVWGWADPGEKVKVKGSWQWFAASTKADENGNWKVKIRTPKAGEPQTLTVTGNNELVLNDVLIGEVWICSGQSNMEYTLNMLGDEKNLQAAQEAKNPQIRLFNVVDNTSTTPLTDCQGGWQLCTPETAGNFSAVGYYFGQNLQEHLEVPIGLISSNWGGTVAEAWTSGETLKQFDAFKDFLTDPEAQLAAYQQKLTEWETKVDQIDPGCKDGWYQADFDDADWSEMQLPQEWGDTELSAFDGIVWFRHDTSLPPTWARRDMEFHLGPIDDIDTLWVNGIKIGTTARWDKPRVYRIPASILHVGKNMVAVRVIDTGGGGGFHGEKEDMWMAPVGSRPGYEATLALSWKYKVSRRGADIPALPADVTSDSPNRPAVLYNAMIAPLIPFRIAGAIWYQGEANCYDPILYRSLFPAMIADWRQHWDQGKFPFYYVQIAPYDYGESTNSQAVREAQLMTLSVPKTGMAVTLDIGAEQNIHPKDKVDVGDRLARWALAKTYGHKDIVYSGPLYKSMKVEGNSIRIRFDYIDGGLNAKNDLLQNFLIAGEDKNFIPAKAVIEGNTVVVSSKQVNDPVAVRYGWSNWVDGSLFNEAGLPASSFRTDDWPLK